MDLSFSTFRNLLSSHGPLLVWWPPFTTASQRQALLRLIAVGIEQNLSLIPLLEGWAEDERGLQRWRMHRLLSQLYQGRTLPDAVEAVPGLLREEDVLAIRFDAQSGTRTAAIRDALQPQSALRHSTNMRVYSPIVYCCVIIPIALLIISFLRIKILPVVKKIFAEFGMDLPLAIQWSSDLGSSFAQGGWLVMLGLLIALILLFSTKTGRKLRRTFFGKIFRPMGEWHSADVLQKIALATRAGLPVAGPLSTLARYHFDPLIRQDLLFVRNEMEQGADIWDSMLAVGILNRADVRAVRSGERIGNQAWVLSQLAQVKQKRTSRRFRRWSEFVLPAIVILLAGFVLLQALTIFQPLTQLIFNLA